MQNPTQPQEPPSQPPKREKSRLPTRQIALGCGLALLAGCVAYHERPLRSTELHQALAVADAATLAEASGKLRHPRLKRLSIDLSRPLSDEAVGVLAVLVSPDLKAVRAKQQVADAQVFSAGLLPDPKLTGRFDFIFSGPAGLFNPYSATLNWDLSKLATRSTDRRIAERRAEQVRLDIAWQEWLVANQARLLARRSNFLSRQRIMAEQSAKIAEHLLEWTRANTALGDAKLTDLGIRQAAFLDAQDRALALARQLEKNRQDLNRLLGLPPDVHFAMDDALPLTVSDPNPKALFSRAENERLDLAALRAGYVSQETAVYRTILGQYPAFTLGMNNSRGDSDHTTGGPSLTFDIPIFNRNRGAIAVAETTRDQLYREYVARLQQTRADIGTLVADLDRIAQERAPLAREVPELARTEQTLRAAAQQGDVTLVNYEAVRANYLDKQLKLLALDQAAAEQSVALQLAVGQPIIP